jgi:hypothetical protein
MKKFNLIKASAFLIPSLFIFSTVVKAQVSVLTQHNDLKRTGWNANETILTQSNVNSSSFGKLFSRRVDDQIYAQPLVVSNLNVNGKVRNVVFVATMSNTLYAFDADDATVTTPLWHINLTKSGYRPIKNADLGCTNFKGNNAVGIVSTPVIDTSTKTLYVVTRSVSRTTPLEFVQHLLAIDITTGAIKPNGWVKITATVNGSGDGSVNGKIPFNAQRELQRPGLLLYNSVVYIAWASQCDVGPYHGWVIGYDAKTLQQKYVYCNTPEGAGGGIWMSGQAPAVDDNGFIYVSSGNGTVGLNNDPNNPVNVSMGIVKLSTVSGSQKVVDFFTPSLYQRLNAADMDYGVDGVMLIPNTTLSLSGSKQGISYLVNTNKMGKISSAHDSGAIQKLNIGDNHIHGTPVYFKNNTNQEYVYFWAEGDNYLKQIPFNRTTMKFDTTKTITGTTLNSERGAVLAVSSNGQVAGTGIVWVTHPIHGLGDATNVGPGLLQAFDANDVRRELWNSNLNLTRDSVGLYAKFVAPTIANGKVYIATFSKKFSVYGLLPSKTAIAQSNNIMTSNNSDASLSLSPNPAQRQVKLAYKDAKAVAGEKAKVDIFGSTGNIIYTQDVSLNISGALQLNVILPSTVQNGVYTVRVSSVRGTYQVAKLVIAN